MDIITLPIPLDTIPAGISSVDLDSSVIVDMSKPSFPTSPESQIKASIIFIRNTNLHAKFDFSGCSYEVKTEYLLTYMTSHYRVRVAELITTWVKIIARKYGDVDCESILNDDELDRFISENQELVTELIQITGSIPVYAMNIFWETNRIEPDMEFEKSDYCGINGWNYFNMLDIDNFINLIQIIEDVTPKRYTQYFVTRNAVAQKIIDRLPYYKLMTIMYAADESIQDKFIEGLLNIISTQ